MYVHVSCRDRLPVALPYHSGFSSPGAVLATLVTDKSLPLTSPPAEPLSESSAEEPMGDIEIGNVLTFRDPIFLPKDRAKFAALPLVRRFIAEGVIPSDCPTGIVRWVKWLGRQMSLDDGQLWKTSKSGTLQLKVLDSPADLATGASP